MLGEGSSALWQPQPRRPGRELRISSVGTNAIARPESHGFIRLDRIVQEGPDRDALRAIEVGLAYAVGKPIEASESVRVTVPASLESVRAISSPWATFGLLTEP